MEAWVWTESSSELFSAYISRLYATKLHGSGWPTHVKTEEDKKEMVAMYKEKFDIVVDPSQVEHNAAKRSLGKLTLNTSPLLFSSSSQPSCYQQM